ncbi:MAG TPA: hypothetical protein PKL44_00250 [Candidatus Dojkabacteria bacterium]|nr:hypothetical protein [Candidatus Dojkabacteria bacterium]
MLSKEEKIEILTKFIIQEGDCRNISCTHCLAALFDRPLCECIAKDRRSRLHTAKRRLAELASSSVGICILADADQIILNQSN